MAPTPAVSPRSSGSNSGGSGLPEQQRQQPRLEQGGRPGGGQVERRRKTQKLPAPQPPRALPADLSQLVDDVFGEEWGDAACQQVDHWLLEQRVTSLRCGGAAATGSEKAPAPPRPSPHNCSPCCPHADAATFAS